MLKDIFSGGKKIFARQTIFLHVALMSVSFALIAVFSSSTSFMYSNIGGDSAVFQVVGKYWLQGVVPYKELFDHKGPLLFLINAVGWAIHPRSGIMVPQIIFMYIALLFIWRMLEINFISVGQKILFFVLTLIYLVSHFGGNTAGEYSVVFLSAAAYCFMRSLDENIFPPIYGFVYGFGFGACVLLRTTNAMPICCFVLLSTIFLIRSRAFNVLWRGVLGFCAGFAAIVLPFAIYFAAHDALYEALYGTILFNVKYAVNGSFHDETAEYFTMVALNLCPLFLMIIASVIGLLFDKKNRVAWSGFISGLILLIMLMRLRQYSHYSVILVPMFPLLFVVLRDAFRNLIPSLKRIWKRPGFSVKRLICNLVLILIVPTMLLYCGVCLKFYLQPFVYITSPQLDEDAARFAEESRAIKNLQAVIPDDERHSFMTWGISGCMARWVLETDMRPRDRFFYNQAHFTALDPSVRVEWFDKVTSDYPLWILYGGKLTRKAPEIFIPPEDFDLEKILEEKYVFKGEVALKAQTVRLYRLKK